MVERIVTKVNKEHKEDYNGVVMYELNLTVNDNGTEHDVDVLLLEEDYNLIKKKGYYIV